MFKLGIVNKYYVTATLGWPTVVAEEERERGGCVIVCIDSVNAFLCGSFSMCQRLVHNL